MKKELRLVEHYTSTQGEGSRTGVMTQFVRFAGCNMRCPLWPCDTQFAIEPSIYMNNNGSYKMLPQDLYEECVRQLRLYGAKNVCLTGGEPWLQNNEALIKFIQLLQAGGFTIECFSNGSFLYPEQLMGSVMFMMDWKLNGSGEGTTEIVTRKLNALQLTRNDGIKFVIKNEEDLEQAIDVAEMLRTERVRADFWIGSAWDQMQEKDLVEFLMARKLNWKLNVQVHKYIWPAEERGV